MLMTGIRQGAQYSIIKRWRARNYRIESHYNKCGRNKKLSTLQQAALNDPQFLKQICGLNLSQRVVVYQEKLRFPYMHSTTLRSYYLGLGIKYRRPGYQYQIKQERTKEIQAEQMKFVGVLLDLMRTSNEEVIYIDETTFHLWQHQPRAWLPAGVTLNFADSRGRSITLIGAISSVRGLEHLKLIIGSNNSLTFSTFINELKDKLGGQGTIVMDNLSAHKSSQVQAAFDNKFKALFLPPHSCALNPIERLWALIKRRWQYSNAISIQRARPYGQQLAHQPGDQAVETIQSIISAIPRQLIVNLCTSHYPFMIRVLDGCIV